MAEKERKERLEPRQGAYERAARKYESRTGPALEHLGLGALQPGMVSRYREQAEMLGRVWSAVCGVTDSAGVPSIARFWYQGFGRQVYKLWRRRERSEYRAELELVREKWRIRGLDPDLMLEVQAAVIEELEKGA